MKGLRDFLVGLGGFTASAFMGYLLTAMFDHDGFFLWTLLIFASGVALSFFFLWTLVAVFEMAGEFVDFLKDKKTTKNKENGV